MLVRLYFKGGVVRVRQKREKEKIYLSATLNFPKNLERHTKPVKVENINIIKKITS